MAFHARSVVAPSPARVFGSALGSTLDTACLPVSNRVLAICLSQGSVGGWTSLRHVGNGRQNWISLGQKLVSVDYQPLTPVFAGTPIAVKLSRLYLRYWIHCHSDSSILTHAEGVPLSTDKTGMTVTKTCITGTHS